VDLRSADGTLHESVLVVSDSGGRFGHTFTPQAPGPWTVQALWQGDRTNSSAVSKVVTIKSGK
jgi:hypothetical protein